MDWMRRLEVESARAENQKAKPLEMKKDTNGDWIVISYLDVRRIEIENARRKTE